MKKKSLWRDDNIANVSITFDLRMDNSTLLAAIEQYHGEEDYEEMKKKGWLAHDKVFAEVVNEALSEGFNHGVDYLQLKPIRDILMKKLEEAQLSKVEINDWVTWVTDTK